MSYFSSYDGFEKIYCSTSYPSHLKLIEAYKVCLDKGYTHYGIAMFPGAMCCISLGDDTHLGLLPISGLCKKIKDRLVSNQQSIDKLSQEIKEIEVFLNEQNL